MVQATWQTSQYPSALTIMHQTADLTELGHWSYHVYTGCT